MTFKLKNWRIVRFHKLLKIMQKFWNPAKLRGRTVWRLMQSNFQSLESQLSRLKTTGRGKKNGSKTKFNICYLFSSVQSLSCVWLFATPWIAACQASLSITNSWCSLRLMFIESVMPSSHLILCRPLLLLPPIPPSIRAFSNESTLCTRWPKYSALASFLPKKSQGRSPSEWTGWISL